MWPTLAFPPRDRVAGLVASPGFNHLVTAVIAINSITLGCEASPGIAARHGDVLRVLDHLALALFAVEIGLRLHAHRGRFLRDPWSVFDALIVCLAVFSHTSGLAVLRALRILRALRLIARVPAMRRVASALLRAVPEMASVTGLLVLILYVASVTATQLFAATDPEHFGSLGSSAFTLFQVLTADGWSDVARGVMAAHPHAWIFFVLYILATTFVILNLLIAVSVGAVDPRPARPAPADPVLAELQALRRDLDAREPCACRP